MARHAHARVRIGAHDIAIPAEAVAAALAPTAATLTLPRRGSPVVGACETAWGVIPVVDLTRWLDLGAPCEGVGSLLVLQDAGRRLAVRADALCGVANTTGSDRLVHDEDPEELFRAAVRWDDGMPASPVLEVSRLAQLAATWTAIQPATAGEPRAKAEAARRGTMPHAIVGAGGTWWALPAACLSKVVPALPLDLALPGGDATRGFCSWDTAKLPVVDLGLLHGRPASNGAWMALVTEGECAAALPVDAVRQVVSIVPAVGNSGAPVLVPGVGEVCVVDVASMLRRLPQARLDGPLRSLAGQGTPQAGGSEAGSAYVLFRHNATYATPVDRVLQAISLNAQQRRMLASGEPVHLAWRGRAIPVHPLPGYGGRARPQVLQVALLVDVPDGHGPVGLAVGELLGWETHGRVASLRVPGMGAMAMLTTGAGSAETSHVVVDLAEVAYALA